MLVFLAVCFFISTGTPGAAPDRLVQTLVDVTLPLPPVSLLSMIAV